MKKVFLRLMLCAFVLSFSNVGNAQAPHKYLTYIFPSDSLAGFDEKAANSEALSRGFFGSEYHVIMYSMKREFINKKYGYFIGNFNSTTPINSTTAKGISPVINNAPCVNEDFEASPSTTSTNSVGTVGSSLTGWQVSQGQNSGTNGSCTMAGCCPTASTNNMWVRSTPWAAPAPLGTIPTSPFGGTKVLQMNDNITNLGEVVRIQQTFPVTSSNALFQFAYMAAMDGSGHACCDQPFMRVDLLDCMNNPLACPQVSITPPGPSCSTVSATGWATNSLSISYTPTWITKSIDLTPYMGSCITIKITVGDCDGWAHYGYAFIDAQCLPMTVNVNNILFPAGNSAVAVAACGVTTATMTAPAGLGPYTWTGPTGTFTTQTINTTVAGNYTLTMNPVGICTPITRTVNLQFGSFPTAGFTIANSCTTYTIINTGTGPPSIQTYSFAGPGAPSSFTTTNSTSVVNFAPSSTYTIYQTVTNPSNCPATFSTVINTPPGPSPAFSAAPSWTQCLSGNAFTFSASTPGGTHTYSFIPATGAPPTGNVDPYGPVSFSAVGTYTVVHTINSAGCVSSTQSVVTVNAAPTASITSATAPPCAGSSGTLTGAGGPGTLSWAGPAGWTGVGTSVSVSNWQTVNNGVYTLTVNNFGCITIKTVSLTMGTVPTATVSNSGPVCMGSPVSFSASIPAGATYWYWYRPTPYYYGGYNIATPTIAVTTATTSGTYTFYVGFNSCPVQAYTTNVVVISAASTTVSNTGPYCIGQTIQLNANAGAGATYAWSGPGGFTSTLQNPTLTASSTTLAGVYTVTASLSSCSSTKSTTVVINPLPNPIMGSNSPVCLGNTINLSTTGGGTYSWSGPNSFTSLLQNPTIPGATNAMGGIYTVTVTSSAGCKNTGTVSVTITTPTSSAANTGPYCAGATIQLSTPGAGTSYTWTGPGYSSNVQNPTIPGSTSGMSGTYSVIINNGGCLSFATTSVTVNTLPTPVPNNTGPYCPNQIIQLNVGSYVSYTWSATGFNSNLQNPTLPNAAVTNSGSYAVTVTDNNGCIGTSNTNVVVNPTPVVSANTASVCENGTIILNANGGSTYSWTGPAGFTSNVQNPNISGATMSMNGVYTVLVTSAQGCTNTAVTTATVDPIPTPVANVMGPVCIGGVLSLSATGGVTYVWNGPNGTMGTGPSFTVLANSVSYGGTYNVTAFGPNGCSATTQVNTVVNPLPTAAIISANNKGCSPVCATFTVSGTGIVNAMWTMGDGSFVNGPTVSDRCYSSPGIYTVGVTATDVNGCTGSNTNTVEVYPIPVADFNHAPIRPVINIDAEVAFTDASWGANITSWNWYFMNTAEYTSVLQNPSFMYTDPGTYAVALVVKSDKGCTDTIVRPLVVGEDYGIYVPNAFTPNADGLNDIFQPKGFGIVNYEINIYDRWGEKVYSNKNFDEGWDGTFQGRGGKIMEEGSYTWLINLTNVFGKSHELKGHVILMK
jgi:gliding motility-associated-like protein